MTFISFNDTCISPPGPPLQASSSPIPRKCMNMRYFADEVKVVEPIEQVVSSLL